MPDLIRSKWSRALPLDDLPIRRRYELTMLEHVYYVHAPTPYAACCGLLRKKCHQKEAGVQLDRIAEDGTRVYLWPAAGLEIAVREVQP